MAGAMIDRAQVAQQLMADGLVEAADIERQTAIMEGRINKTRSPFDPSTYSLSPSFRLCRYADLRARKCKVPTKVIQSLLHGIHSNETRPKSDGGLPKVGLCMDCSITPIRLGGLAVIQTTESTYPIVDDPVLQGRISCACVLSSLYALGVTQVDNMLCLLSVSTRLTESERDTLVPLILQGFKEAAQEAGTAVSGGQTVMNPWLTVGGVATSICKAEEYILPDQAIVGDVLVLTKPLGTQIAVNAHSWLEHPEKWSRISESVTEEEVRRGYGAALDSMAQLNRSAAILMQKHGAHGATEVSKFGLLGHAAMMARSQANEVSFVIHNLPIIAKMDKVDKASEASSQVAYGLLKGESCEISGGLLVALPREAAAAYCKDMERLEGNQSWIIGIVERGDRTASLIDKPRIIEVPTKQRTDEETN